MEKKKNDSVNNLERKFNLKLIVHEFFNHVVQWPKRNNSYLILIGIFPLFVFLSCKFLGAGNVCVSSSVVII